MTYPVATHDIVDVVAKLLSTRSEASTDAEFLFGDELGPLVVLHTSSEGIAVEEPTNCAKNIVKNVNDEG